MMRKSGFHVQATSNLLRDAIFAVKPTVIVSLAHDRTFWEEIKRNLPNIFLIGRRYEERVPWWGYHARDWADLCASLEMPYDAFITYNEPKNVYNEVTPETAAQHDDWCCEFRRRIMELGYQAVALNVPTGHFHRNAIVNLFPNVCQEFDYIGLHEYSARAMWDQDPTKQRAPEDVPKNEGNIIGHWYCQRYRDWYEGIVHRWPERTGKVQMVVTECGITYDVMKADFGDVGWRTDMGEKQYVESLKWYFGEMNRDDYCLGGAIFMMGANPDWASFETLPLWKRLLEIPEAGEESEPPPPPPNGGDMDIKIYDFDHSPGDPDAPTVDWDWLRDTFGDVRVLPIEDKDGLTLQEDDVVYKLDYLDARLGDANIIINVRDEDGNPVEGETVMFGWPDAPAHGYADKPSNWTEMGVPGDTNADGDVGPGYGTGAYYSPAHGERGPHFVWIWARPSDYVDGLGMIAGTNHAHVNLGYRAVKWGGEQPGPGPGPGPIPPPDPADIGKFIAGVKAEVGQDVMTVEMDHGDGWKVSFYEGRVG